MMNRKKDSAPLTTDNGQSFLLFITSFIIHRFFPCLLPVAISFSASA